MRQEEALDGFIERNNIINLCLRFKVGQRRIRETSWRAAVTGDR